MSITAKKFTPFSLSKIAEKLAKLIVMKTARSLATMACENAKLNVKLQSELQPEGKPKQLVIITETNSLT